MGKYHLSSSAFIPSRLGLLRILKKRRRHLSFFLFHFKFVAAGTLANNRTNQLN